MKNNREILPEIYTFTTWTPAAIKKIPQVVLQEIKKNKEKLISISKNDRTFENTIFGIESLGYKSTHNILLLHILMNLSPKEGVRKAALKAEEEYEQESVALMLDDDLYRAFTEYLEGNYKKEKKTLGSAQIKLIDDLKLFFKNSGFLLDQKSKKEFKKNIQKSAELSSRFGFNINAFNTKIEFTKDELVGIPQHIIDTLEKNTKTSRYKVPASGPIYADSMKLGQNRDFRKKLATTALLKGGKENIDILEKLIILRDTNAKLLGYGNHIEATLATRMAKNEKTANTFLGKIYKRVEKTSKKEKKVLDSMTKGGFGASSKAEFFDTTFYSNLLYEKTAALDTEYIKQFFETQNTFDEMLALYGELFSLTFSKTSDLPVWEKSVKVVKVQDRKSKETLGYIYIDLYPREGKYSHAMVTHATNGYQEKCRKGKYIMPICALVCNFPKPTKANPSLLSLRDVETIFHEFGHALHTVLTKAVFESQSGTNVTWDFVEAPSQMLENFLFEEDNLKKIGKHYKTGKTLDTTTIKAIIKNKNFMNATHIARQLLFGFFDFEIHNGKNKNGKKDTRAIYNKLYTKVTGNTLPKENLFPAGFGHMVGYDAGYYSYMWALVYAQDIYSQFQNAKTKKERNAVGLLYRKTILERGSSRPELVSVTEFLGRKPNMKAFFTSQGI